MSRGNIFLIVNLGCEMFYVIDQRLKAQCISLEKSAQVLRDLTCVLLDPRFLNQLINPKTSEHKLLTPQQCRILLTDIACCSLMRLDTNSMDKLWDLMVIVFKWQLFIAQNDPAKLFDVSFRHLDGIGRLIPEMRKSILIDCAKKSLIDLWDTLTDDDRLLTLKSLLKWLKPFRMKISILLRLGLQKNDGSFDEVADSDPCHYYAINIGENIYGKSANMGKSHPAVTTIESSSTKAVTFSYELESLAQQFNVNQDSSSSDFFPISILNNIILDDNQADVGGSKIDSSRETFKNHEFIHINKTETVQQLLEKLQFSSDDLGGAQREKAEINVQEQLLKMMGFSEDDDDDGDDDNKEDDNSATKDT